eukprot:s96_g12.t1
MEVPAPRPPPGLIWTASTCRPAGRLFEARTAEEAVCCVRRWGISVLRAVLPLSLVYGAEGIIGNPIVDASLAELLGADYAAYQLAVDVPYQGSEHQPLHSDVVRAVDAGLDIEPPSMISVNFPLVDIHEENGPLEILPGSQEVSLSAAPALLAKRHLRRVLLPLAVWGFAKASAISGHLRGGRRTGCGGAFASRISIPEDVEAGLEARQRHILRLIPLSRLDHFLGWYFSLLRTMAPTGTFFVTFFSLVAAAAQECGSESDIEISGMNFLQMNAASLAPASQREQCLRFMHIPKTGGTSIDSANMHLPAGQRAFDSLMLETFLRVQEHMDGVEDLGKLYDDAHHDRLTYGIFIAEHLSDYRWLPEDAADKCEDLHTPPSRSSDIALYYQDLTTEVESKTLELLSQLNSRPYLNDCFFMPQVLSVYGVFNKSSATHQYCQRILHTENLDQETFACT